MTYAVLGFTHLAAMFIGYHAGRVALRADLDDIWDRHKRMEGWE